MIADADGVCVLWAMGVTQHTMASDTSTAISNCFPGLEFDFRNLWRRAFVGIVHVAGDPQLLGALFQTVSLGALLVVGPVDDRAGVPGRVFLPCVMTGRKYMKPRVTKRLVQTVYDEVVDARGLKAVGEPRLKPRHSAERE